MQNDPVTIKSFTISKANHLDFSFMAPSFNALNRKKHTWLMFQILIKERQQARPVVIDKYFENDVFFSERHRQSECSY